MLFRTTSYRRYHTTSTRVNLVLHPHHPDPDLIFSPDGSQVLSLNFGRRITSPSRVECPSRPRMRHDPSLVDMTGPQLPLEAEEDINVTHAVQRKNPCALCNVGFFHGAMNLAIISAGLHFLLMVYCICIALNSEEYTNGFLHFWEINLYWADDNEDMKHVVSEVHIVAIVGGVIEVIGSLLGVELIFGIVKESANWCYAWCVFSCMVAAFEFFGLAFLSTRLSFIVLIPIPFVILVQAYALWVILTYVKSLADPKLCPVCHHVIGHMADHYSEDDCLSLPMAPSTPMQISSYYTSTVAPSSVPSNDNETESTFTFSGKKRVEIINI
ncbi:uncharacterized protein LOC118438285 [Folsomia candida]|uniref:Uncharacterized protein n=1 Tax=Folsomia candida TaxID=158441 RepID=A0A226F5W5_FOLCA|nr:uncharacterized protein LOC118438285 [Folsomia candida]OXA64720.1 hypothetical protein Fcan01_03814 [Folsomia candida]